MCLSLDHRWQPCEAQIVDLSYKKKRAKLAWFGQDTGMKERGGGE